jgi:hypothetical protein
VSGSANTPSIEGKPASTPSLSVGCCVALVEAPRTFSPAYHFLKLAGRCGEAINVSHHQNAALARKIECCPQFISAFCYRAAALCRTDTSQPAARRVVSLIASPDRSC